jgi:hypothetical protein
MGCITDMSEDASMKQPLRQQGPTEGKLRCNPVDMLT